MSRVTEHIRERMADRERQDRQEDYLKKYFLQEWLYTESGRSRENLGALTEDPGDILNRCTRMILAGSANAFFETEEEHFIGNLKERIRREFYYINLNSNESLFLFAEKYTDYAQVAESLYQFFAQQYDSECYFAVSREVQGWQGFPGGIPGVGKPDERTVLSAGEACGGQWRDGRSGSACDRAGL